MTLNLNTSQPGFKYRLIALCISFSMVLVSCLNEEVCEDVSTVPVRIGFYATDTVNETPSPISISNISVFGLGQDSIIYENVSIVSQMELPLNSTIDSCAYIFRSSFFDDNRYFVDDTLWFVYNRLPNLISMECGFTTFYELTDLRYSRNLIDSVAIDDSNITNSLNEHIKIFPWLPEEDDEDNGDDDTDTIRF